MQIIGITGRSGCGKSTLTDSIRAAGFRCVDADQVAREVLLPGSPCIVQLSRNSVPILWMKPVRCAAACWRTVPLPHRRAPLG